MLSTAYTQVTLLLLTLFCFFFKKTHSDGIVTSAEELGDFKAAVPGMAVKEQAGQGQL